MDETKKVTPRRSRRIQNQSSDDDASTSTPRRSRRIQNQTSDDDASVSIPASITRPRRSTRSKNRADGAPPTPTRRSTRVAGVKTSNLDPIPEAVVTSVAPTRKKKKTRSAAKIQRAPTTLSSGSAQASAKSAVLSEDHGKGQDSEVGSPNVSVAKGVAAEASVAKSAVSSEDGKGQDSEVGSPNALAAEVNSDDVEGKLKFTITTQQHTQNNV